MADFMFGSTTSPSLGSASKLTGEQSQLLSKLTTLLSGQVGQGVPTYPGSTTAQPAQLEQTSWNMINDLLGGGIQGQQATSQQAIGKVLQGTQNVPNYDVGEFDPTAIQDWYTNALVKPAMNTWSKDVVPQIQEKFISQNAASSGGANRAIAGSAENLMTGLNAQLADKLFGEKQAFDTREYGAGMQGMQNQFTAGQNDLSRMLQIPQASSQSMEDLFQAIGLGTGAGATQRAIDQAAKNEEYQKWLMSQGYSNPWLQMIQPTMGADAIENIVNQGSQQQGAAQSIIVPLLSSWLANR